MAQGNASSKRSGVAFASQATEVLRVEVSELRSPMLWHTRVQRIHSHLTPLTTPEYRVAWCHMFGPNQDPCCCCARHVCQASQLTEAIQSNPHSQTHRRHDTQAWLVPGITWTGGRSRCGTNFETWTNITCCLYSRAALLGTCDILEPKLEPKHNLLRI